MNKQLTFIQSVLFAIALVFVGPASASMDDPRPVDEDTISAAFDKPGYSPYAGRKYPTRALFGDTRQIWEYYSQAGNLRFC